MDRREFIKLTAVTGSGAALSACGNPEHGLIRFVPDEDIVPGIAEWKPSVCPLCSAGCGLNVRVMDADFDTIRGGQAGVVTIKAAKKLEGHPAHPISRGGLCPRGQAAIQVTYHPDRLTRPLKRAVERRGAELTGEPMASFKEVTWDEAIGTLVDELDKLAAARDQKSLVFLARPRRSRRLELAAEFLNRYGAPAPIGFELFGEDVLRRANALGLGRDQLPTFDLARARYVVSFGADFLGTWNSPVAQNASYGEMRQGRSRHGVRGKLVQIEARMSLTGASADEWVPIRPGTEGALALGLAHVLLANKLVSGDSSVFAEYTPDRVETITGVPAKRVDRLARELVDLAPAVAIIGGPALAHTNGLFHATAVNALNAALDNIGQPGGVFFTPPLPFLHPASPLTRPAKELQGLSARVLMVDDVNPVFGAPRAWKLREALDRVPFIASFGSFLDDTSVRADLILPDHSFLESWVDSVPESGSLVAVANVAAPVMRALHQTRATPDVLLEVAGKLKSPIDLPWKSYEEMLKASFEKLPPGADVAWAGVEKQGGWWDEMVSGRGSRIEQASLRVARPQSLKYEAPRFDGDAKEYPFHFLPYASQAFLDGSVAHLPWLQELPDPLTSAMWCTWVEINPQTAAKLAVAQGDIVEVTSTQGSLRAPAVIFPGIPPDTVGMPVGQGHETFTRYASGRGANPIGILAPLADNETGALAWAATRVKIARVGKSDGSLIMFGGEMRENPHGQGIRK